MPTSRLIEFCQPLSGWCACGAGRIIFWTDGQGEDLKVLVEENGFLRHHIDRTSRTAAAAAITRDRDKSAAWSKEVPTLSTPHGMPKPHDLICRSAAFSLLPLREGGGGL
jgi:hypothetical protein